MTMLIDQAHHLLTLADQVTQAIAAPNPGSGEAPPGVGDKILKILRWVAYLASAACVGGILVTAGRMAIAHRRTAASPVLLFGGYMVSGVSRRSSSLCASLGP